jgi:5-methylcytosine-specific restriction enzyme subunit McrC
MDRDNRLASGRVAASGYVYQIYAYLRSQVGRGDALADSASGLLLHPSVGPQVDQIVVIQGHGMRFATVDLTASAASIRSRLLCLCDSAPFATAAAP